MPVEYQSEKRRVNAEWKHRAFRFVAGLSCLGILGSVSPAVRAEAVSYPASDGVSITAELYRGEAGREAIVLLHRTGSQSEEFGALPEALVAQGFHVLAPDLRGHGRSDPEERSRATDASPWLRDGPAAIAYLRSIFGDDVRIGLVGIERGAEIAARTMSGMDGAGPLILLDPEDSLAGLAILQPTAGTRQPVLIIAGREDARAREGARSLFLLRPSSELWLLDGGARIVDRLLARADFATDLAGWITQATRR